MGLKDLITGDSQDDVYIIEYEGPSIADEMTNEELKEATQYITDCVDCAILHNKKKSESHHHLIKRMKKSTLFHPTPYGSLEEVTNTPLLEMIIKKQFSLLSDISISTFYGRSSSYFGENLFIKATPSQYYRQNRINEFNNGIFRTRLLSNQNALLDTLIDRNNFQPEKGELEINRKGVFWDIYEGHGSFFYEIGMKELDKTEQIYQLAQALSEKLKERGYQCQIETGVFHYHYGFLCILNYKKENNSEPLQDW